jgi:IS5 family transposase
MSSFFFEDARALAQKSPMMKLHQLIDCSVIGRKLRGIHKRESSHAGGPNPYDRIGMFKLVLLGQWHGLSDAELEQALRVRIDFMVFTGFEPASGELPDASTICRYRNKLGELKLDVSLLEEINGQLEQLGLKVKGVKGAVIDATIVQSEARPNQYLEVGEEDQCQPEVQTVYSADRQARWTKKGKKAYYGYKAYTAVDTEDGYTEYVMACPANESEVLKLRPIVQHLSKTKVQKPAGILADKGYASQSNRAYLQEQGIEDFIQHKASRGKALTSYQRQLNTLIGKVRYKIEQSYGTMKRRFGIARARYFGIPKVRAQVSFAAIGMNLLKAQRKMERAVFTG